MTSPTVHCFVLIDFSGILVIRILVSGVFGDGIFFKMSPWPISESVFFSSKIIYSSPGALTRTVRIVNHLSLLIPSNNGVLN